MVWVIKGKHLWTGGILALLVAAGFIFLPLRSCAKATFKAEPAHQPVVYLTFDDGPSANTAMVLDVLKQEGVHGTFFVIGKTKEGEIALYKRIIKEENAIGVHTYSHNTSKIYSSLEAYMADFTQMEDWLYQTTGQHAKICRMPGGTNTRYCTKALRKQILNTFVQKGYACFDWDIDALDSGSSALASKKLSDTIIKQAQKHKGEDLVILMHDDALRVTLPEALESIIHYFKDQGYRFGVLEETLQILSRKA